MYGHFSLGIKIIKRILVDFDVDSENFILNICAHVVNMYVYVYKILSLPFKKKHFRYKGGANWPTPADFKHLQISLVIG